MIPTSTDTLSISLQIKIQDHIGSAPVNWTLNDNRPDIGTVCRLIPTNETAIFLKTMRLQDAPLLEHLLLADIGRFLGKRVLQDLSAGFTVSKRQPAPLTWALLWIPENCVADPGDISVESFTSGHHRLWPKSLLSPLENIQLNTNIRESDTPITLEMAENHIGIKKPTALYNESLKIHEAIEKYKTQQATKAQEETKLDNDSSKYSDILNQEDYNTHGANVSDEYLSVLKSDRPIPVNDGIEDEDEEDLFASSPSPALAEESTIFQDPASGQENPIAMDSVEQASASMFTPTHHSDPQYAPIKYDVSPTDPDGRTKVYQTAPEAMITDDDFNFFDANAEIPLDMSIQQLPYEEYGDLSGADFGVNPNQPQAHSVPHLEGDFSAQSNEAFSDNDIAHAMATDLHTTDGAHVAIPEVTDGNLDNRSPRSDDDLWHEDYDLAEAVPIDLEVIPEHNSDVPDGTLSLRSDALNLEEPSKSPTSIGASSSRAIDKHTAHMTPTNLPMNTSAPDTLQTRDAVDYSQTLQWTLVNSLERMIPAGFDEITFLSPICQSERRSFTVDRVSVADKYGDGRVGHRTHLLQLLKEQEASRQQRAHGRLPFHRERSDLGIDAFSAVSMASDKEDIFADSADDASDVTAASSTQDDSVETQGLFTLGRYPFSSNDYLFSTGFAVTLDEYDSTTLRKRVMESNDSAKRSEPSCPYPEGQSILGKYSDIASLCPSALESSDLPEYIGE